VVRLGALKPTAIRAPLGRREKEEVERRARRPQHMAQFFSVHPENPQPRLIRAAVDIIRKGGVVAYPTDSCYALGCHIGDKAAMERLRRIRDVDERHHFTLVCRNLSEVGVFAKVDNLQYRLMRANTPGRYTFILRATRDVPRRLLTPRHTIGVRIPAHPVPMAMLQVLDEPLLSTTLILPAHGVALNDAEEIRRHLEHQVELVIDAGACDGEVTTVVDLSAETPRLVREGAGDIRPFGFVKEALH
jgi:tRNA threonylcarbamoyl adenosine modification protein (Sua5/YciO/YrdC/YwlC family)